MTPCSTTRRGINFSGMESSTRWFGILAILPRSRYVSAYLHKPTFHRLVYLLFLHALRSAQYSTRSKDSCIRRLSMGLSLHGSMRVSMTTTERPHVRIIVMERIHIFRFLSPRLIESQELFGL